MKSFLTNYWTNLVNSNAKSKAKKIRNKKNHINLNLKLASQKQLELQLTNLEDIHNKTLEDMRQSYWSFIVEQKERYKKLEIISNQTQIQLNKKSPADVHGLLASRPVILSLVETFLLRRIGGSWRWLFRLEQVTQIIRYWKLPVYS